eukprot:m.47614 g.47614  ORF g.47614 m.47614 type:complete len:409 (-) comp15662_c0_seq2:94-1320(-)
MRQEYMFLGLPCDMPCARRRRIDLRFGGKTSPPRPRSAAHRRSRQSLLPPSERSDLDRYPRPRPPQGGEMWCGSTIGGSPRSGILCSVVCWLPRLLPSRHNPLRRSSVKRPSVSCGSAAARLGAADTIVVSSYGQCGKAAALRVLELNVAVPRARQQLGQEGKDSVRREWIGRSRVRVAQCECCGPRYSTGREPFGRGIPFDRPPQRLVVMNHVVAVPSLVFLRERVDVDVIKIGATPTTYPTRATSGCPIACRTALLLLLLIFKPSRMRGGPAGTVDRHTAKPPQHSIDVARGPVLAAIPVWLRRGRRGSVVFARQCGVVVGIPQTHQGGVTVLAQRCGRQLSQSCCESSQPERTTATISGNRGAHRAAESFFEESQASITPQQTRHSFNGHPHHPTTVGSSIWNVH